MFAVQIALLPPKIFFFPNRFEPHDISRFCHRRYSSPNYSATHADVDFFADPDDIFGNQNEIPLLQDQPAGSHSRIGTFVGEPGFYNVKGVQNGEVAFVLENVYLEPATAAQVFSSAETKTIDRPEPGQNILTETYRATSSDAVEFFFVTEAGQQYKLGEEVV